VNDGSGNVDSHHRVFIVMKFQPLRGLAPKGERRHGKYPKVVEEIA